MHRRILLLFIIAASAAAQMPTRPISTKNGQVSGEFTANGKVAVFKGIPFAAPPLGDLRWREPQPAKNWNGTLKADHFSLNCIQAPIREMLPWTKEFMLGNDVSEDCLYLNIWTGALTPPGHAPVYVYIYGGAFSGGAGDVSVYDGENLAKRGIIVVTFNYRIGVLGFLAHPQLTAESPHHSSGNYGLLDQLAALHWISENIAAFGGDPHRITVGGQSAGAISVNLLVASPLAKGLFVGAVAESGSGVIHIPTPTLEKAEQSGVQFAKSKHTDSIQNLRKLPWQDFITRGISPSLPNIDGWYLPMTPAQAFEKGTANAVPTITGWVADDYFGKPAGAEEFRKESEKRYGEFAKEFLELYPAASDQEALDSYKQAARDRNRVSMYLWAVNRAKTDPQPAFTYFFTRAIPWPEHPEFQAFHTGEVPYIFDNLDRLERPWTPKDHEVARILSTYLIDFVSTGDPNGNGLPRWPAFDPHSQKTMEIGEQDAPIPLASPKREKFWLKVLTSPDAARLPFL